MKLLHLLGKLIIGLTGFFLLLSLTARALGSTQPPNPALRGFSEGCEDKPQPCWYGIVLDVTDGETAYGLLGLEYDPALKSNSFYTITFGLSDDPSACWVRMDVWNDRISRIDLIFCAEAVIQIGELAVFMNRLPKLEQWSQTVYFGSASQFYIEYSPHDLVKGVGFWGFGGKPDLWHGFVPHWRYCQLEPETFRCK